MKSIKFIIILGFLWLVACQEDKPVQTEADNDTEQAEVQGNEVRLNASQVQLAGIKSAKPQQKKLASTIKANGMIDVPPENIANIHALMEGFVKDVRVLEGQQVKKGQVLAALEHPDYVHLQESYLKSLNQLAYSEKELARQEKLSEGQATALKTLQQAQTQNATLKSEVAALEAQIKMLGINIEALKEGKIANVVYLRAPFTGTISDVNVNLGQFIAAQDQAFEMVNKSHIHGEIRVFARDILKVYKGQKVRFKVNGNEDKVFEGEVFLVGETVDRDNNTVNVHVHPTGDVEKLKIGMFITAELFLESEETQVVPELSVVQDEENNYVFVDKGDFVYEMFPIQKGTIQDGYCAIEGLPNDLNVVTEGANYLWASR